MNDSKQQNTWVYGIVPAGASLDEVESRQERIGVDVWVVELGDLAAIVGDAPSEDDAKALRGQALAHARVLEAAILDAPVVPFRFGNVVPGDDEAVGRELLESRHDEFMAQLEKLKNYVQVTVKVSFDEQAVLRQILESNPDVEQLREQARQGDEMTTRDARVQLGEMISNALEELRQKDASEIIERLKPVSAAALTEELESEYMVLNAPFLVERDRLSEFEDTLEEIAEERRSRLKFTLLGPMPAYNFLDVEQPAWA
jgi:Gas vesicle synthesis protein GvpL/GvpF